MAHVRFLLCCMATLAFATLASAEITGYNCDDDDDGAIVMSDSNLTGGSGTYTLSVDCTQYWGPGHVEGDFITDSPLDPTVWIIETVDNQTSFAWTGYHIDIGMTKEFTITGVVAPSGWTYSVTQPVSGQPLPSHTNPGTGWVGSVDYYGGTAIAPGGSGNFGLVVSFLGDVAFCTEQVPVPEPATMGLLGLGGLGLLLRRKR